ncbi:MAG: flavodoxin family protein [Oscillospiraceae bacterium]|nr:flavodoxin family protein [Oscillospiraceae bacterium]
MKTVLAINGSPRRGGSTAQMLASALKGAQSAGAVTEIVHLSDLQFSGCTSCFACKRLGSPCFGSCGWQDELTPVLSKILTADAVVIGSPIYFGDVTGMVRNLTERLLFPNCLYDKDGKKAYDRRVPVGLVFTMNVPEARFYQDLTERLAECYTHFLGPVKLAFAANTWQFDDYSKYSSSMFDVEEKRRRREEVFPTELESAFQMGRTLLE